MIRTRSLGWIPAPASPLAWLVFLGFAAFAIEVFFAIDARSHSVSDTLFGVFPYWAPTFLLWCWMGARSEGNSA